MTSILQSPVANSQHIPHLTQNLVDTRTLEKGAVTPQETDPDLPGSAQESLVEAWVAEAAAGSGALSAAVPLWGLLKESPLSSLPPP